MGQRKLLNDYYDANIRHADRALGGLFEFLKSNRMMDNTLIILTADHGKILGEYPRKEPVYYMRDVNIRVPLLIYGLEDFLPNEVVSENVELLCLFETLKRMFNLNAPDRYCTQTLRDAVNRRQPLSFSEALLPYVCEPGEESYSIRCLRKERYKYIETNRGIVYLYDIIRDPTEMENLADREPQIVEDLHLLLMKHINEMDKRRLNGHDNESNVDPDLMERLRNLGYI